MMHCATSSECSLEEFENKVELAAYTDLKQMVTQVVLLGYNITVVCITNDTPTWEKNDMGKLTCTNLLQRDVLALSCVHHLLPLC